MSEIKDLSIIKLFKLLENSIGKIDTYPLSSDNLVIQQDAYKRLAMDTDEIDEHEAGWSSVFATLSCDRRENDRDLCFRVFFTPYDYFLSIDGVADYHVDYWANVQSEEEAADRIISGIQMLANGQLAVLVTFRGSHACASELLYYQYGKSTPQVLRTYADFPWWWSEKDNTGYEFKLLRNNYHLDLITHNKRFFFFKPTAKGTFRTHGRTLDSELLPLTKGAYKETMESVGMQYMGGKKSEHLTELYYRSWEFWAIGIGILCIGGLLRTYYPNPSIWLVLLTALLFIRLRSKIMIRILARKQYLKEYFPDHPWLRFETKMAAILRPPVQAIDSMRNILLKKKH